MAFPYSNTSPRHFLSQYEEDVPQWLENYDGSTPVKFSDIMSGRIGYYPGSGFDGNLIATGNRSHSVHSFLYVDYGISRGDMLAHLSQPDCFRGYHSIGRIDWEEKDIMPNGQYPVNVSKKPLHCEPHTFVNPEYQPYCFTEILERNADRDHDWGAARSAVTFLFADGILSYYQLFCMEYRKAPWIFLLQDHGFGGNYDCFGKGGILDAIIKRNDVRPEFVLCADNTHIWNGYERIAGMQPIFGGMHHHSRHLYRRK